MDAALLNLLLTISSLALAFAFRKRILAALGRLLLHGAIEFARREFVEEGIAVGEDGEKRVYVRLRPRGEALVGALVPVLAAKAIAWAKANVKLTLPPGGLPPGLNVSNLAEALPQVLSASGIFGKGVKGQAIGGVVGMVAQKVLGGFLGGGSKPEAQGANPFLKELKP